MHIAMVWIMLSSCGASHHSLSRYVASLLAAKSRSSCRAQIAFAYRSELVVYLSKQQLSLICALAYIFGLWPSATFVSWNPHPLRLTLIDVCLRKHQWCRSVPGFQLNSVCRINNQCMETYPRGPHKIPTKNSNT